MSEEKTYALPEPVGYRILVKMCGVVEEKSAGGIILTDTTKHAQNNRACVCEIVSMGADCYSEGDVTTARDATKPWCKAGDKVLIGTGDGKVVPETDNKYRVINSEDVFGIYRSGA